MQEDIEKLLSLDNESLYLEIGNKLTGKGAFPFDKKYVTKLAKNWMREKRQHLAEILCDDKNIRELIRNQNKQNRILLITAIADLISSIISIVPAVTVAVLIVKEGFESLCSKKWSVSN